MESVEGRMIEAYPNGKDNKGKHLIAIFKDGELIERLTMEQIAEMYRKLNPEKVQEAE